MKGDPARAAPTAGLTADRDDVAARADRQGGQGAALEEADLRELDQGEVVVRRGVTYA